MSTMVSMTSFEIIPSPESPPENQEIHFPDVGDSADPTPDGDNGACACSGHITPRSIQSLISSLFDSKAEGMRKCVDDLLQQNRYLKEKVKKSNVVMLEQLNTISSWGKDIKEYKQKQNDLLEEKQKLINDLQLKVDEMQAKIEQMEVSESTNTQVKIIEEQNESNEVLKKQNDELTEIMSSVTDALSKLQDEKKVLETEVEELRDCNNCLLSEMTQPPPPARSKGKDFATIFNDEESGYAIVLQEEDQAVPSANNMANKAVLEELSELQMKYVQLQTELENEKMKSGNLDKQLEEKNKQFASLSEKSKGKKKRRDSSGSNCSTTSPSAKDYEELAFALWAKSDLADIHKKTSEELGKELDETKSVFEVVRAESLATVAELRAEVSCLKESVKQEEYTNELQRKSLIEAEKNLKHLSDMHDRAMRLLNGHDNSDMMKQRQHLEDLDMLTAKLFNMEQLFEAEREKSQKFQQELSSLKQDSEDISVLKTQVEIYKADFESEKLAVECSSTEVEKLKKEKTDLEEKLNDLMGAQSRKSHKHSRYHHQKDRRSHKHRNSAGAVEITSEEEEVVKVEDKVRCECPYCKMIFHNVDDLTYHVDLCMKDDIFNA